MVQKSKFLYLKGYFLEARHSNDIGGLIIIISGTNLIRKIVTANKNNNGHEICVQMVNKSEIKGKKATILMQSLTAAAGTTKF